MSHLGQGVTHCLIVDAALECAKDKPEAPVQVLEFLQRSLTDIRLILQWHDENGVG